ncbi:MAG: ABC transporter permease [Salinisphaera sp.]|uniref:ABC transporter permease n=1 Tax=Salinisphaera sp. TaxID=1914330 RepID=UPI003C7A526B
MKTQTLTGEKNSLRGQNAVMPFNRRRLPLDGWEITLLVLFLAVVIGFSITAPGFYDSFPGLLSMTENFLPYGFVALGLSLVIFTGGIDLSVGTTASLAAVVAAQLWSAYGLNIWLAAGVGLGMGAALGALNAAVIIRLKVEPLIATLATSFIYGSAAVAIAGDAPPSGFPDAFNAVGSEALGVGGISGLIPYQLMLFMPLCVVFWLLVSRTAYGRKLVMVGYSSEAARYSGIRDWQILVTAYVISGLMAALAGLVLAAYYSAVRPDMGDTLLLTTLTMVVLGGVSIFGGEGTMLGVIIAVLVLGFLRQGMLIAGYSDMVTTMVTGAILVLSIAIKNLFNTRGTGLGNRLWTMFRQRRQDGRVE